MAAEISRWHGMLQDVLAEIFLEYLPTDPLLHMQPDVTEAPMVLCQICSHWRRVALGFPKLWGKLYHISSVAWQSEQLSPTIFKIGVRPQDIDFLRWWCNNLRPRSPVLRLRLDLSAATQTDGSIIFEENEAAFFPRFLSSAKYLDLGPSYITALQQ